MRVAKETHKFLIGGVCAESAKKMKFFFSPYLTEEFPNWWYTVPMAVHTFLEEYDFSGKTVVPFVTHGTGGLSSTIKDITADLPDSVTVLGPIGVYRLEVDSSKQRVQDWVAGLDLSL